jgi:hypothetical protein
MSNKKNKYIEEIHRAFPDPPLLDADQEIYEMMLKSMYMTIRFMESSERFPECDSKKELYHKLSEMIIFMRKTIYKNKEYDHYFSDDEDSSEKVKSVTH